MAFIRVKRCKMAGVACVVPGFVDTIIDSQDILRARPLALRLFLDGSGPPIFRVNIAFRSQQHVEDEFGFYIEESMDELFKILAAADLRR